MVYINWEACSCAALSPTLKWYSVEDIMEYIQKLRAYIIYGSREKTNVPLLSCTDIPACKTKRFQGYFICEGIGDWRHRLDGLNCKLTVVNSYPSCRLLPWTTPELGALSAIHDMLKAIETKIDTIDQNTFEARYGLIWEATTEQEDGHDVMKCPNIFCRCYKNTIVYISVLLGKK